MGWMPCLVCLFVNTEKSTLFTMLAGYRQPIAVAAAATALWFSCWFGDCVNLPPAFFFPPNIKICTHT